MKFKYIVPFLFPLLSQNLMAQRKVELNSRNLDVKSEYLDASLQNAEGLRDVVNTKGNINLKYSNSALYFSRNGLLNNTYGANFDINFLEFYHNQSEQNTSNEIKKTQDSPIGQIVTRTTTINEDRSKDFGFALKYKGFFTSYELANRDKETDSKTIITIGNESDIVPVSYNTSNESIVYGLGMENAFFKFSRNQESETDQGERRFDGFLSNLNYGFFGKDRKKIRLDVYYDKNFSEFLHINAFGKVDLNLSYDSREHNFTIGSSTPDYSRLNHRDFERNLENRMRGVPRIYDANLETTRKYLEDMFFTEPGSYNFSVDKDNIIANINAKIVLMSYSKDNQKIGIKYKFAIGTYDLKQKEAKFGVFFR